MAAFDFPNAPTVGQIYTPSGGPSYAWTGTGWALVVDRSSRGGFINQFYNPGFEIAQRGTSGTGAGYCVDGWQIAFSGGSMAWSQQFNAVIAGTVLRLNASSGMTFCDVFQRIESTSAAHLLSSSGAAQPVTVQFTLGNHIAVGTSFTPQLYTIYPNTVDNYATAINDFGPVDLQPVAFGQTLTVAYTFTPSPLCTQGYWVGLRLGGALNATGGFLDISSADIRGTPTLATGLNNNPPLVELRPRGIEQKLCERYFQRFNPTMHGVGAPTSVGRIGGPLLSTMRAVPSLGFPTTIVYTGTAIGTFSTGSVIANYTTTQTVELDLSVTLSGASLGDVAVIYQQGAMWTFSAEL